MLPDRKYRKIWGLTEERICITRNLFLNPLNIPERYTSVQHLGCGRERIHLTPCAALTNDIIGTDVAA
jgi:hypothetical protein